MSEIDKKYQIDTIKCDQCKGSGEMQVTTTNCDCLNKRHEYRYGYKCDFCLDTFKTKPRIIMANCTKCRGRGIIADLTKLHGNNNDWCAIL